MAMAKIVSLAASPSSSLSSLSSFHTAPGNLPSSRASLPAVDAVLDIDPSTRYREARLVPRALRDHCHIYLEEQLYSNAINLLNSLLVGGVSSSRNPRAIAYIPPPAQLAFICSLIVHPQHTTKPDSPERREIAGLALTYLRNVLAIVGPQKGNLAAAFRFHSSSNSSRRNGSSSYSSPDTFSGGDDVDEEDEKIGGKLGGKSNLWYGAQDFWSVVGWAFTCSALHPKRWSWWRAWLEFMVDVMETDCDLRRQLDEKTYADSGGNGQCEYSQLRDSILMGYMNQRSGRGGTRSNMMKWIVAALFADGEQSSRSLFHEVFHKETRDMPRPQNKRKREQRLNLEKDQFADYLDDDDDDDDNDEYGVGDLDEDPSMFELDALTPPTTSQTLAQSLPRRTVSEAVHQSIHLRLRIIKLISSMSVYAHTSLNLNLETLYDMLTPMIKTLPVDVFACYIEGHGNPIDAQLVADGASLLMFQIKELLSLFLPPSRRMPHDVDADQDALGFVTQPMLERCYLPFAANTISVEDNAKLSLLLQQLILLMTTSGTLRYSSSLRAAADRGIEARLKKAKPKRARRNQALEDGEQLALARLKASDQNIEKMLDILKALGPG